MARDGSAPTRLAPQMTDAEALMWSVEKDPWFASTIGTILEADIGDGPVPTLSTTSPTAKGAMRSWTTLEDFVQEVGSGRIYDGVHYRNSTEVGSAMGRQVGALAVDRYLRADKPLSIASGPAPHGTGRDAPAPCTSTYLLMMFGLAARCSSGTVELAARFVSSESLDRVLSSSMSTISSCSSGCAMVIAVILEVATSGDGEAARRRSASPSAYACRA